MTHNITVSDHLDAHNIRCGLRQVTDEPNHQGGQHCQYYGQGPFHPDSDLLLYGCSILYDGSLVYSDLDFSIDLKKNCPLLDFSYGAIDATCGDDLITLLKFRAEFLEFLLLLTLWTNHKEPHDKEHKKNHNPKAPRITRRSSLSGRSLKHNCQKVHFLYLLIFLPLVFLFLLSIYYCYISIQLLLIFFLLFLYQLPF